MFRISRNGHDPVVIVDTVEEIEPVIRRAKPGRYHIDELGAKPLPSGHTSCQWGVGIKKADGTVAIEPDPWPE